MVNDRHNSKRASKVQLSGLIVIEYRKDSTVAGCGLFLWGLFLWFVLDTLECSE